MPGALWCSAVACAGDGVIKLAAKLEPCVVAMEACCGAHQPRAANHRPCDDKGSRWTVPLIVASAFAMISLLGWNEASSERSLEAKLTAKPNDDAPNLRRG